MNPDIKVIIYEEKSILKKLLSLLDEQYDCIINKDVIQMDKIASKLDEASKELAKIEIQRRNIMGSEASMRDTISLCDDENIKSAYEEIVSTIKMVQLQKEANDTFELCIYVDSLEKKLEAMSQELANVQEQLKEIHGDTVLNHLKSQITEASERFQSRCNLMREQIQDVKENMRFTAKHVVSEFKIKGKEALNKVSDLFKVKDKLVSIRENVRDTGKDVELTIYKIDAFGAGMREANQKIANTFKTD